MNMNMSKVRIQAAFRKSHFPYRNPRNPCWPILRLQSCVGRGDELVSENLHLRTESAEVEEAEDGVSGGQWGPGGMGPFVFENRGGVA